MTTLILDTDGGVDDAQALLMLLANGRVPDAITTVFGNVPLAQATDNILAVLAVAGADVPVHAGAVQPLAQAPVHAQYIHGDDGLGGAPRPSAQGVAAGHDAPGFICDQARAATEQGAVVDLLMIGPLTNLALALHRDPGIVRGVGRVTIMGGTLNGRGNTTPAAEVNIFADPEAAAVVFRAGLTITLVPWEPCTTHFIPGPALDEMLANIPEGPLRDFGRALADHSRRTHLFYEGRDDVMKYVDTLAAAIVIDPASVTGRIEASVDVALAPGITRGMTVVDPSGRLGTARVDVVETADGAALDAIYRRSLGG